MPQELAQKAHGSGACGVLILQSILQIRILTLLPSIAPLRLALMR
jgi:hypothetical protein